MSTKSTLKPRTTDYGTSNIEEKTPTKLTSHRKKQVSQRRTKKQSQGYLRNLQRKKLKIRMVKKMESTLYSRKKDC